MPNDITVTKNETPGSERWDVAYTADQAATVTKTMETGGTILDRDIKVSVTTPAGSAVTPATAITANPTISVSSGGLITATASASQSVTPTVSAGFVSSGTAGTITVSGSNTSQLTTQAAQTIYPSTTDQTIASGKYLTGAQTIKAVTLSNLSAGNIKKDVVVKVGDSADDDRIISVTGTYEGSGGTDFVVTISYNSATNMWEPDCTFAELEAAVTAGKTIVATGTNSEEESVDCAWKSAGTPRLEYYVRDYVAGTRDTIIESYYRFASGGLMLVYSEPFIVPTGTKTLTSKGTHSVSDYANAKVEATDITGGTITPTTTSQTIASAAGLYNITAALTVAGDANLLSQNIAAGVTIFNTPGSLAFSTIYSGSSAPSSSTGVNGDIYLQI